MIKIKDKEEIALAIKYAKKLIRLDNVKEIYFKQKTVSATSPTLSLKPGLRYITFVIEG
jgi:hypothetical protein